MLINNNPPCPKCNGRTQKKGKQACNHNQRYACTSCNNWFVIRQPKPIAPNNNPACPRCGGQSQKAGFGKRFGNQEYLCKSCKRQFSAPRPRPLNSLCPYCKGHSHKAYRRCGNQSYTCTVCKKFFTISRPKLLNSLCPRCGGHSCKRGKRRGRQQYYCTICKRYFRPKPEVVEREPEVTKRKQQARALGSDLLTIIDSNLSKAIPADLREDIAQEIALDALCGKFDLKDLPQAVPRYRRKIYGQQLTGYRFVSLDAPIRNTDGLTYADSIAG
jgi:transposase-like protein